MELISNNFTGVFRNIVSFLFELYETKQTKEGGLELQEAALLGGCWRPSGGWDAVKHLQTSVTSEAQQDREQRLEY